MFARAFVSCLADEPRSVKRYFNVNSSNAIWSGVPGQIGRENGLGGKDAMRDVEGNKS